MTVAVTVGSPCLQLALIGNAIAIAVCTVSDRDIATVGNRVVVAVEAGAGGDIARIGDVIAVAIGFTTIGDTIAVAIGRTRRDVIGIGDAVVVAIRGIDADTTGDNQRIALIDREVALERIDRDLPRSQFWIETDHALGGVEGIGGSTALTLASGSVEDISEVGGAGR